MNRQAMFRPDGSTTSVPVRTTEEAPMQQLNLDLDGKGKAWKDTPEGEKTE